MSTISNIEWTDTTWNPVTGCTRVSAGCDHCYAVKMTHRLASHPKERVRERYAGLTVLNGRGDRHFNGVVRCHEDALCEPLRWRQSRRVFVNSMADLFHKDVPFEFIDRVFAVMALFPQHIFQILTKRPERMAEYLETRRQAGGCVFLDLNALDAPFTELPDAHWQRIRGGLENWPLPNVWLGTSVENQDAADERIPHLLRCPAVVRFLSCEPLLGDLDISKLAFETFECANCGRINNIHEVQVAGYTDLEWGGCIDCGAAFGKGEHTGGLPVVGEKPAIHWVIVGGESGPGARPMHPAWARSIRDQCADAGVPFFFKQWGAWRPGYENNREHTHWDDGECAALVGKKAAGRLLDGVEHNGMPEATA